MTMVSLAEVEILIRLFKQVYPQIDTRLVTYESLETGDDYFILAILVKGQFLTRYYRSAYNEAKFI